MSTFEHPQESRGPSSSESDPKKHVVFEMRDGTSVDSRRFDPEDAHEVGSAAAEILRANELSQAENLSSVIRDGVGAGHEENGQEEKNEQTEPDVFYARLDEAMKSLESAESMPQAGETTEDISLDDDAVAALEGLGIIDFKKPVSELTEGVSSMGESDASRGFFHTVASRLFEIRKMVENAVGLKLTNLSPEQRKAYGAAALTAFAALPMNEAEAGWLDFGKGKNDNVLVKEVGRGVDRGTRQVGRDTGDAIGGVIQDVGGAIRRSIGLETPQERRARERQEAMDARALERGNAQEVRQFKLEQAKRVGEDTKKVTEFERITNQYKKNLESIRKTFNQEFDSAQNAYMRQRDQAKSPEQASRSEREQWQRWLSSARNAMQKLDDAEAQNPSFNADVIESLKQRVAEAQQKQDALSQSSSEMRRALSELATAMEGKLGVSENGVRNPLRGLPESNGSSLSRPVEPIQSSAPSNTERTGNTSAGGGSDYSLLSR